MATFLGGIPLFLVLAALVAAIWLNVSACRLEKRLSLLVEAQLDRVGQIERALSLLKGKSPPQLS